MPDEADKVELRAKGSFYEEPNMGGRLLQAGDTFTTDRGRAVELRANGLVAYVDDEAEKKASAEDLPPAEDTGVPVITTRSLKTRAKAVVTAIALLGLLAMPALAQTQATFQPNSFAIDNGTKTATAVAGAVTLNKGSGVITTEALVTAAAGTYVLTVTDSAVLATDLPFASVSMGTSTTGLPDVTSVKPANGSLVITVQNAGTAVFNGTLKVAFFVLKN